MFGLLGARGAQLVDDTPPEPPSLEMLVDPGFDNPSSWPSIGGGSEVSGSQLISLDDGGGAPTLGELRAALGGTFIPGSVYQLRCNIAVLPGGAFFRLSLFGDFGTQLLGNFNTSAPIDQTFVADGPYSAVMVQFFEFGIRLDDLSIELVPP